MVNEVICYWWVMLTFFGAQSLFFSTILNDWNYFYWKKKTMIEKESKKGKEWVGVEGE